MTERLKRIFKETQAITQAGFYVKDGRTISLPRPAEKLAQAEYFSESVVSDMREHPTAIVPYRENRNCAISVTYTDSLTCAGLLDAKLQEGFRMLRRPVLVLNFANPHFPGGGVENGAKAQEEDLCRRSTLYCSLASDAASGMYADNIAKGGYEFTDGMVLSPNVVVFRNEYGSLMDYPFVVSVLSAPAPYACKLSQVPESELFQVYKRRILGMLHVASARGYDNLVLGAWGCGAFGGNAGIVANAFRYAIAEVEGAIHDGSAGDTCVLEEVKSGPDYKDMFSNIEFAVLDKSSDRENYRAFSQVLAMLSGSDAMLDTSNRSSSVSGVVGESDRDEITVFDPVAVMDVDAPGTLIRGRFRVQKLFKRNSIAASLLVADEHDDGALCVMKTIRKGSVSAEELRHLILEEYRILAKLDHPGISRRIASVSDEDQTYAVYQYIEGRPLEDETVIPGAAWEERVCSWMLQVCGILDYLHSQNPPVVHRDIKPSNILVDGRNKVSLIDFECAMELDDYGRRGALLVGTKGFIAPEAVSSLEDIDVRSDIYSVGATMWSLLAYGGREALRWEIPVPDVRRFSCPEWRPSVSEEVASVVMRCLEVDPDKRYQSANELATALIGAISARNAKQE